MEIRVSRASLLDPERSAIKLVNFTPEPVFDCDGSVCGWKLLDENGELELLPPHYHMYERGQEPEAGPRCHAIRL